MHFDFEAAAISIALGAVLSVLLQGRLVEHDDATHVPPRVAYVLRVLDVWLVVVFGLLVIVVVGASLHALMHDRPLRAGDRHAVRHLLTLAAIYPLLIALSRRMLPILYAAPEAPYTTSRVAFSVLLLPLLGLAAAILMLPGLVRDVSLDAQLVRISLVGLLVVGPCAAMPLAGGWWGRRALRRIRARARELRLREETVIVTIPHVRQELSARVFTGTVGGIATCWLDVPELDRLVHHLDGAHRSAEDAGADVERDERWFWSGWPWNRLILRCGERQKTVLGRWTRLADAPFVDGGELLASLRARRPLSRD